MSQSDSESDDLRSQALPIGKFDVKKFDPTIAPSTAEEYLQRVIWEAKQCEDIVTVELNREQLKQQRPLVQKQQKMQAPTAYLPSKKTQQDCLEQFSSLREKIELCRLKKKFPPAPVKLPTENDSCGWSDLCFGNEYKRKESKTDENIPVIEPQQPLLSILLNISPIAIENLLEWHEIWLKKRGFTELQGRWFFSVLACLEKPLTPETCHTIRGILQSCALIRASLEREDDPLLAHLNMLITIVAKYFGQNDLADPE